MSSRLIGPTGGAGADLQVGHKCGAPARALCLGYICSPVQGSLDQHRSAGLLMVSADRRISVSAATPSTGLHVKRQVRPQCEDDVVRQSTCPSESSRQPDIRTPWRPPKACAGPAASAPAHAYSGKDHCGRILSQAISTLIRSWQRIARILEQIARHCFSTSSIGRLCGCWLASNCMPSWDLQVLSGFIVETESMTML